MIKFKISCVLGVFLAPSLMVSNPLKKLDSDTFLVPHTLYSNNEVWDNTSKKYKKLEGQNYCAIKSKGNISNKTLVLNNKKEIFDYSSMEAKLDILTPDTQEVIETKCSPNIMIGMKQSVVNHIPFLVSAYTTKGDVSSNKLLFHSGEVSSVYYLKPSHLENQDTTKLPNPNFKEKGEDAYRYLITPALTQEGTAKGNYLEVGSKSYVNMGVEDTYTLTLNGAPYLSGGVSLKGSAINNKVSFKKGAKLDFHAAPYKLDKNNKRVYDSRISHIIGGYAYNGEVRDNLVNLEGGSLIVHGKGGGYSSSASAHVAGAFVDSTDGKAYNAVNNTIEVNNLGLDLRLDTTNTPNFYDALLFAEFFGGKTIKGDALSNTIKIKQFEATHSEGKIKVQGVLDFIAGSTNDGVANNNSISIDLTKPFGISENYLRANILRFIAGYGTLGASNNKVSIVNNLTQITGTTNSRDKVELIAARTLSGEANNNEISIKDSQVALPLYIYTTDKENFEDSIHYAENAKNNKITLSNVFGRKDIRSGIEAMNLVGNTISYHNVEAQSSGDGKEKESSMYIRATNLAKDNTFSASNYYATSALNMYGIRGEVEARNNKILLKNVSFSTDREGAGLVIIGGVGQSAWENLVSIEDLSIGKYAQEDYLFIAASAIPNADSNLALSYGNTLYIGGEVNIDKDTTLNAISGSIIRIPAYTTHKDIITLPAPSLAQLGEKNHLIVGANLKAKVINNFEYYSFVLNKNLKKGVAVLESLEAPINLSENAIFNLYKKGDFKGKITLLKSQNGFADFNGNALNSGEVTQLLAKINNNKALTNLKDIQGLKGTKHIKATLKLSQDGKEIYTEI
ncbi:hypothetical protein [Helicobacter burdigaliensis]|uniref:hypothetical protein n=1 Tax=Helicobacter burdigaliensis TaxID=2315334 RepID=UPI000EF68558|nr:hypothetical protein [Helicobacter burdigaliensis]